MYSEWLRSALDGKTGGKKISQAEASRRLTQALGRNIDRAAVNKMVSGERGIAADELMELERMTGQSAPRTLQVPLKGYVGAGQAIHPFDDHIDMVDAPPDTRPTTVAVEVRGDSMFPAYEDRSILYYSRTLPPESMVNRRCIVQLTDARVLVKILRPGSQRGFWTLSSVNALFPDILDVTVDWVAPIDWVKPAD